MNSSDVFRFENGRKEIHVDSVVKKLDEKPMCSIVLFSKRAAETAINLECDSSQ